MVSPHELKNKEFQKAMRGYSIAEVDEYIEFILAQYTELYRQNAEMEQQLAACRAKRLRSTARCSMRRRLRKRSSTRPTSRPIPS